MKKFHLCIAALALVFLFVAQGPSQAIASSLPRYVSELKISTSEDSAEDAKQWLSNNGYKVLDSDLNDGTGEGYVYLGYKTTTDKSKAVTNISLMEMNGGFKRLNCRASLQAAAGNIDGYVDEMMTMAQEFRANLEAGTLTAKLAKRGLDLFYVPEAGNKCLSDYLTASTTKTADFYNLLLMTNSTVLSSIYSILPSAWKILTDRPGFKNSRTSVRSIPALLVLCLGKVLLPSNCSQATTPMKRNA